MDLPDGKLGGMEHVAMLSILMTLMVPPMLLVVERRIAPADQAAAGQVVGAGPGGAVALAPQSSSHH